MYVKPTKALLDQVHNKINEMFKTRLEYAQDWNHYGLTKDEFDKRCLRSLISYEEDAMICVLGNKWFNPVEKFNVRIPNGSPVSNQAHTTYSLITTIDGRGPYIPAKWGEYYGAHAPTITEPSIIDIATRRREAHAKIESERETFTEMVDKTWAGAPSVNALAKIWPPIRDLLPDKIVQAIDQKTVRRTAKTMAEEIDTKELSVHILKAKVAR